MTAVSTIRSTTSALAVAVAMLLPAIASATPVLTGSAQPSLLLLQSGLLDGTVIARRGADDPAGHIRRGRGKEHGANHT